MLRRAGSLRVVALPATVPPTLPDLELALGQVVIDALQANGLVVSGTPTLFTSGSGTVPADCCPKEGEDARVVVWWTPIDPGSDPCGSGPATVTIHVRQFVCWPIPSNPLHADDAVVTEHSAYLARSAWVGTAALQSLICDAAARRAYGIRSVTILPTQPKDGRGGCISVGWSLRVSPYAVGWYVSPT